MNKQTLLDLLYRWIEPYNPMMPLELETIDQEQRKIASNMSIEDIKLLMSIYKESNINDLDLIGALDSLLRYYGEKSKEELVEYLFKNLKEDGPREVIRALYAVNDRNTLLVLMEKINFIKLDKLSKLALIESIDALDKHSFNYYINIFKKIETDKEILHLLYNSRWREPFSDESL